MSKRDKILEGASQIFYRFGLSKISMDELAEQLGVSKKTIYNHFGGKEHLFEAVLRYYNSCILERVMQVSNTSSLSAMERLSALQAVMMEEFGKLQASALEEIKGLAKDDSYWNLVEHEQISNQFEKTLLEAREMGFIKESVDVKLVIFSMICIGRGMLSMKEDFLKGFEINAEMTNKIHGLFQEAILTEEGLRALNQVRAKEMERELSE